VVSEVAQMAQNLTEEQKAEVEEAFAMFDKKKGRLDAAALGQVLRW
jgi:Ca2+-binding EF-hand superfamily protein